MTPDRFARYDRALAAAGCDAYLSGSSADVHYLTGSEDGNAFVMYQPSSHPTIVVRASGFNCTVATAKASDVVPVGLAARPADVVAERLRRQRPRRVAVGPVHPALAEELASRLDGIELMSTPRLGRDLRRAKEPGEIRLLEAAASCVGAGIVACFGAIRPGLTDRDVAAAADSAARRAGADSVLFLQVKAGPRSAYPDAEEVGRSFGAHEIGIVDVGVLHRGYRGDFARAFVVGEPSDEALRVVEVVERIQREAVEMVRPGLRCSDFYNAVHQLFVDVGYPHAIPHHLGHGAGVSDDTIPMIVPTSEDEFVEGEVVCVEPGLYIPGVGGARIEDTIVIRAGGNEVISPAPRVGRCASSA